MSQRLAVVLFNLGGPDGPEAVRPFLLNLFSDSAIIRLPQPLRWGLARLIAAHRTRETQAIYAQLGGKSPLLEETRKQAESLQRHLLSNTLRNNSDARVFVAMRYWHPLSAACAAEVAAYAPDEIVLLPLYPQFSSTTTASSLAAWERAARAQGLQVPTRTLCCYACARPFIEAHAALLAEQLAYAPQDKPIRVLFSAHGLPEKVIRSGDPYQWQVEQSAAAIMSAMAGRIDPRPEWRVCYQSRVGPMKWIGPETADEIKRAGREDMNLAVVPIAFVSEHSETLVELDIDYRRLAQEAGVAHYLRVPALGTQPAFIEALGTLVETALSWGDGHVAGAGGGRLCPAEKGACGCRSER